jgi:hypothetical protein
LPAEAGRTLLSLKCPFAFASWSPPPKTLTSPTGTQLRACSSLHTSSFERSSRSVVVSGVFVASGDLPLA